MIGDMGKKTARELVAINLKRLMAQSARYRTQEAVARAAGVKQNTVSHLLNLKTTAMQAPKLNTVEGVAGVFGLETWQLLIDPDTFGQELGKVMQRQATPDARLEDEGWRPRDPTATQPPAVRGLRGRRKSHA